MILWYDGSNETDAKYMGETKTIKVLHKDVKTQRQMDNRQVERMIYIKDVKMDRLKEIQ